MKKKTVAITIALAVIIGGIWWLTTRPPSSGQVKKDLASNEHFLDADFVISKVEIETQRTVGKQNATIAMVVYDDDRVEYTERYVLEYNKSGGWKVANISGYEPATWEKRPLKAPTATELQDDSLYNLKKKTGEEYDSFTASPAQEPADLQNGVANYSYEVKKDTKLRSISGTVMVTYEFESAFGDWFCNDISLGDYKTDFNMLHSWEGYLPSSLWRTESNFRLTINNIDEKGNVTAEFRLNDDSYLLSGTLNKTSKSGSFHLSMTGVDDSSKYLDGYFKEDTGNFSGRFNPVNDAKFYFAHQVFDIDLSMVDQ